MAKKGALAFILLLCLALPLFLLCGCGSASYESYENELQELSERISAELRELAEKTAVEGRAEDGTSLSSLGATFSEMADLLEEGARELSYLKVPAGREGLQSGLLELLQSAATACRKMAKTLLPASEGHAEGVDSSHGNDHAGENVAEPGGEAGAEHGVAPETGTHGAPAEEHGH